MLLKKKERNMPKLDESICQIEKIGGKKGQGKREKRVKDR